MPILYLIISALVWLFSRRSPSTCHICGAANETDSLPNANGHLICAQCWDGGYGYRPAASTEPEYRVERYAQDDKNQQIVVNFFRRLLRLPIRRDPAEEDDKVRRSYLRARQ